MFNNFIELGKLTDTQKEKTWKETLSASQMYMLYKEPYNLIREKLGKEKAFPSVYDNIPKQVSESAMANGKFYEEHVMKDIAKNFMVNKRFMYDDVTFAYVAEQALTATPDFVVYDDKGNIESVNDIKCSGSSRKELEERYMYQVLHQCAVIGVNKGNLWIKGVLSKPIEKIAFEFTDEEILSHINYCTQFLLNLRLGLETAYDHLVNVETKKEPADDVDLNDKSNKDLKKTAEKFWELTKQKKELDAQADELKQVFKDSFSKSTNLYLTPNDYVRVVYSTKKPSTDWETLAKDLIAKHNEPESIINNYTGTETKEVCTISTYTSKKAKVFKN